MYFSKRAWASDYSFYLIKPCSRKQNKTPLAHWTACWSTIKDTWHHSAKHTHPPVLPSFCVSPLSNFTQGQQHRGAVVWSSLDSAPIFFSFSFFNPDSMATLFPWRKALTFSPPAPETKARSYRGRWGVKRGEQRVGDRRIVRGMKYMEEWGRGIMGRCLGWRLWGETSSAMYARAP